MWTFDAGGPIESSAAIADGIRWAVEAEVDYVRFLADSAENANEGDADDIIFRLGFRLR